MPRVGRTAMVLGIAGLLPSGAGLALTLLGVRATDDLGWILAVAGYCLAMGYGALILSFLGGIWWGYAMRREERQGRLAVVAVLPSLIALATVAMGVADLPGPPPPLPAIVLGTAIVATLIVDRHLVRSGDAPANWLRLRAPLSIGLGALTIAVGIAVAR